MGTDITFTAGLNPSAFEKGISRIEELGRRAAMQTGGKLDRLGDVGDRAGKSLGIIAQVAKLAVFQRAAHMAFSVAKSSVDAFAKSSEWGRSEVDQLDASITRMQAHIGRDITLGIHGLPNLVDDFERARTSIVNSVADIMRAPFGGSGGDSKAIDKALDKIDEYDRRAKVMMQVRDQANRLNDETMSAYGGSGMAARYQAARKYEEELKKINELKGATDQEKADLRYLALSQKEQAISRANRMDEAESAKLNEENARKNQEATAKRIEQLKEVDQAAVDSLRAKGLDVEAQKLEVLFGVESRLQKLREQSALTVEERARAEEAVTQAARDQVEAIDRTAEKSRRDKIAASARSSMRSIGGGLASPTNIAQTMWSGSRDPVPTIDRGLKRVGDLLQTLIGVTRGREVMAVLQ